MVTNYVFSFSDNGVGIKTYLNEEISRLKEQVKKSLTLIEVKKDSDMVRKTKSVLDFLDSFVSKQELSESDVQKLLKIQMLVDEVSNNGN